jgi:ABC-type phosphate/phosphonate transport system substrate-binding protein
MSLLNRRLFLKALPALGVTVAAAQAGDGREPLTLVVMDPLAAPLACSCVKGYAQRDYEKLGKYLEKKLQRPVKVHFGPSLSAVLVKSEGKADLIVGKESVVRYQTKQSKLAATPIAALTGDQGETTMTGLVVVYAKDEALTASDLQQHRILFGEASSVEKHEAPLSLLKDLGLTPPTKPETCSTCSDGAKIVVDAGKKGEKVAAVISSYAKPLLEGCGTVQKGELRVIGETDPVPFIVAFANDKLPAEIRAELSKALLGVSAEKELLAALETKTGFVHIDAKKK